ncbi:MAG TPA: PQQ-binding-like beta-propeller repeat protein [Ktedonobacteraceae bacterium]|nr:PQQ-binding-like beta-propeller repeat protein [Ktedonobacteraceae bacterium]
MLYVLASQITAPLKPQGPLYISAVDTNGRQSWTQPFTDFSPAVAFHASLEAKNGTVYAFATGLVKQSNLSRVAAYDANSGKQLWSFQVNAQPESDAVVGMAICHDMMYLWTPNDLSAYSAKNGSLLWQKKGPPFQTGSTPRVEVTDTAIVFASLYLVTSTQRTTFVGNALNALNPKNGGLLWKMNIPTYSPPQGHAFEQQEFEFAATDRAVYTDVLNPGSPQKVAALSSSIGKQLWSTSVEGKPVADKFHFPFAVVGDNVFYVSTSNYGVVSLDTNDGRYLWQDNTISQLKPLQDKLYVTHTNMSDFCQLDPVTGKSQWCNSYADDSLKGATSNQTIVYIPRLHGVNAVQKNNGKVKWIYKGNTSGTAQMMIAVLSLDY